jgi:hypothetical protein
MTGFNKHKVLPDKEGGNFLFCTVYWGVQIRKGSKFCKLMKQLYQFVGNFSPFLVKKIAKYSVYYTFLGYINLGQF